jgi:hypothetical protein
MFRAGNGYDFIKVAHAYAEVLWDSSWEEQTGCQDRDRETQLGRPGL